MPSSTKLALVAEDNAALNRVIAFTLRKQGFEVETACDGAQAWEIAQHQPFDLIVTDQQMPNMTGLELIAQLRESSTNSNTPTLLLTAKGLEIEADRVRDQLGVAAVLLKPFSPNELARIAESQLPQEV